MHLDLEVWNTHRHLHIKHWLDESAGPLWPDTSRHGWDATAVLVLSKPTCDVQGDCVRGGPSPQWLVRLKPEVVLAGITQLHNPNLDWAAGIAASDVAGTPDSFVIHLCIVSFLFIVCQLLKITVGFSYRVRPRYDRLIWSGSVWWVNSLRPSADTRNHMTRFTVWPWKSKKTTAKLNIWSHSKS